MKRTFNIFLSILILTLQSCIIREDDPISQNCKADCTQITGKAMTDNGTKPVVGAKFIVQWSNTGIFGGTIRTKATARTDSKGNFYLKLYIRDSELEDGGFSLKYEVDQNKYIAHYTTDYLHFQNPLYINQTSINRDTILYRSYNIIKKAFLNVSALNLDKMQPKDYLSIKFSYEKPAGLTQLVTNNSIYWTTGESEENKPKQRIEVAGNHPIKVETERMINNVSSTETYSLFIEAGTTLNYTVDFNK